MTISLMYSNVTYEESSPVFFKEQEKVIICYCVINLTGARRLNIIDDWSSVPFYYNVIIHKE